MLRSIDFRSTGLAVIDAHDDFRHARRRHAAARSLAAFRHAERHPRVLPEASPTTGGRRALEVIPLSCIAGVVEPSPHFDARFRPVSELVRLRWERIALAHRKGIPLPPITVMRGPDGYYVVDGRHRVSVALARGVRDIDAWVVGGVPAAAPAPAEPERCCA